MSSGQEKTREKILHIYNENPTISYAELGRLAKESRATVRNVILRYKESLSVKRRSGSGRPTGFVDSDQARKVVRALKANPGHSLRFLGHKYGCSHMTIQRIKRSYGLRSFRAQKVPFRTPQQHKVAKSRARRLYTNILTKNEGCVLLDDETYCVANFQQLPGQKFYTARTRQNVKKIYRTKALTKFPKKFLVWQGICSCGRRTKPYITNRTLTAELYVKKCLKPRLLPLYRSHVQPPVFWPDLASIHYAQVVKNWMEENNVTYVPKESNPPCCPELRPVETYWACIKGILRKKFRPTTDIKNFSLKWKKAADMIGNTGVQRLMHGIKGKVRKFFRNEMK